MNIRTKNFLVSLLLIVLLSSCNTEGREPEKGAIPEDYALYTNAPDQRESTEEIDEANREASSSRQNAITYAVDKACPAIVGINVTEVVKVRYRDPFRDDPFFSRFFGRNRSPRYREYEVQGLGSGFLISPDGYILTNHHVAGDASKIVITMTNGEKYDAEIIGSDEVSDVALLKIEGKDFPYLEFSDSDEIITGEWVIALGNPFGLFNINAKPTVTVGVVSNSGVSFIQENRVYRDMIQTDAAISSGNSGGPLVNALGEVIGMNTVIFSTAQSNKGAGSIGIGFSIPINRVKDVIDKLKKFKSINRNFNLGIEVRKIDEKIARYFGLESTDGVVIINMQRGYLAEKAGLEPGDIIIDINDHKILREEDYYIIVNDGMIGEKLNFLILRDDKMLNKSLIITPTGR